MKVPCFHFNNFATKKLSCILRPILFRSLTTAVELSVREEMSHVLLEKENDQKKLIHFHIKQLIKYEIEVFTEQ